MGPFVPDIISNELNLVVALLLGIAFGAVLEQAGFSSSRKLAGVFYGYDFTVLRVFFTAGVTAMLGVLLLESFGYLDAEMIYVNPTFLGPAIVGGMIMGVGFILGGYCPGTSLCAAAIGKKDAIAFVVGGLLGVYLFGELFPLYENFYLSGALGPLQVFDSLGISRGAFALLLVLVAVAAFVVTTRIEKRVNPGTPARRWPVRKHIFAVAGAVVLALLTLVLPDRKTAILEEIQTGKFQQAHPLHLMTADELAFRVMDKDPRLVIVDVRSPERFAAMALPGSVNLSPGSLFGKENAALLGERHKERVFVDENGDESRKAALLATRLGYENVRVLDAGLQGLRSTILDFKAPAVPSAAEADTYRFRSKARTVLSKMIEENKTRATMPKPAAKKIAGGC